MGFSKMVELLQEKDKGKIILVYNKNINKSVKSFMFCGYNLVVECHASDLIARVRFPLPAPNNIIE